MTESLPTRRQCSESLKRLAVLMAVSFMTVACGTFSSAPVSTTPTVGTRPPETTPPEEKGPQTKAPKYLTHTIQYAGETLSGIARWYTGDTRNWRALARANPTIEPKRMQIGDTIRIPEEMVTNRKPMPAVKTTSRQTADPPPPPPKEDKTLFGPIETSAPSSENQLFGPVDSPPSSPRDEGLARPLETLD